MLEQKDGLIPITSKFLVDFEVEETVCDGIDSDCDGNADENLEGRSRCSRGSM